MGFRMFVPTLFTRMSRWPPHNFSTKSTKASEEISFGAWAKDHSHQTIPQPPKTNHPTRKPSKPPSHQTHPYPNTPPNHHPNPTPNHPPQPTHLASLLTAHIRSQAVHRRATSAAECRELGTGGLRSGFCVSVGRSGFGVCPFFFLREGLQKSVFVLKP